MLLIENKKGLKTYTIINKYLCECGLLNEKNVCNACMKYMKRKFEQLLRYYKKGLNSWIELYNNDSFKTKKEKKRMNYYINKLNEFERLLND